MNIFLYKKLWIIISIVLVLLCLLLGVFYGKFHGYIKGEIKETEKIFNTQKNYIYNLEFEGLIKEKAYNKDNKEYKYAIYILLKKINPLPNFSQQQYPPYYSFINDSLLVLSISKNSFDKLQIDQKVTKNSADNCIEVKNNRITILSKKYSKWLP